MIVRGLESSSHMPPSVVVVISVTGQEKGAGLKSQARTPPPWFLC